MSIDDADLSPEELVQRLKERILANLKSEPVRVPPEVSIGRTSYSSAEIMLQIGRFRVIRT